MTLFFNNNLCTWSICS